MTASSWPALRVEDWTETRETLHRWTQVVGKIRLAQAPMLNHWWQVTLYVTPRGLTTSSMPAGNRSFEIEFDFCAHQLRITVEGGEHREVALEPKSVAGVLRRGHGRARVAGPGREDLARPGRDRGRDPVRAGHHARQLRPGRGAAVLASARAGRSRAGPLPRALHRQGQPGALLLGRDGHGRDALLRPPGAAPPGRRAQLRRLGHGRGLLARAGQLRLLAGRRRGGRVLRLRLSRARGLRRRSGAARRRRSTAPTSASSCCPTRRSAPRPTPTPPPSSSCRPRTTRRPTWADWDRSTLEYEPVEGARPGS